MLLDRLLEGCTHTSAQWEWQPRHPSSFSELLMRQCWQNQVICTANCPLDTDWQFLGLERMVLAQKMNCTSNLLQGARSENCPGSPSDKVPRKLPLLAQVSVPGGFGQSSQRLCRVLVNCPTMSARRGTLRPCTINVSPIRFYARNRRPSRSQFLSAKTYIYIIYIVYLYILYIYIIYI